MHAQASAESSGRSGWRFNPVPAVGYDSELGLQYGVNTDLYYYGDGSSPKYLHRFSTRMYNYAEGKMRLHGFYDSEYLVPGIRITAAVTYMSNPRYFFYGFNGSQEPFVPEWNRNKDLAIAYYNFNRNMFRVLTEFKGALGPRLQWAAGLTYWNFRISDLRGAMYDPANTLYYSYKQRGIIREDEAGGGNRMEIKAGLSYDSRDLESTPSEGTWAELYLNASPDVFSEGYGYIKLCAHFRRYRSILDDGRLILAYHLAYQGTVAGEVPFFMQSNITPLSLREIISEGLGSTGTIRGTLYNRLIGDAYAWANFEIRAKLFSFNMFDRTWYFTANPFLDLGSIVRPYRRDAHIREGQSVAEFNREVRRLHASAGAGLRLVRGHNIIISCEIAKALNPDDKRGYGINIGHNYIF